MAHQLEKTVLFFCHFIEFNDVSLIKVPMLCTTCEKKNFRQILCNVILYTHSIYNGKVILCTTQ